jgi:hypothetical protein
MSKSEPRHIVILTFPDGLLLDAAGPLEAFDAADRLSAEPANGRPGNAYRVHLASVAGGMLRMSNGVPVMTEKLDARLIARTDTLLVAGGPGARAATTFRSPAPACWTASAPPAIGAAAAGWPSVSRKSVSRPTRSMCATAICGLPPA